MKQTRVLVQSPQPLVTWVYERLKLQADSKTNTGTYPKPTAVGKLGFVRG